jgi:hypothetical protein
MLYSIPAYNEACGHNQVIHRAHATIEGPLLDMSTISSPAEQRVILDNISWPTYLAILEDVENRRGRIAYDQGVLEIMSPSKVHEQIKRLIGRIVEAFTEQLQLDVVSAGSTTFKRVDLARGFEPDECWGEEYRGIAFRRAVIHLPVESTSSCGPPGPRRAATPPDRPKVPAGAIGVARRSA